MRNQFFYKVTNQNGTEHYDSFNVNKVVRVSKQVNPSTGIAQWVVLLDDMVEVPQPVLLPDAKGKTITQVRKMPVSSEIFINDEDYERFRASTEIK